MSEEDRALPESVSPILAAISAQCLHALPADHVSVALASDDGLWAPAYATSATAAELEQTAFALGEGPCYDALRRQAPVLVADLMDGARLREWPFWVPVATSAGVRSVSALPIQAGAIAAGVLTIMSTRAGALSGAHLTRALRLADTALLGLLDLLAGFEATTPTDTSDGTDLDALRSRDLPDLVRAEVHQAAGMIMVQAGVRIDQALAQLRARSFQLNRPVREVADDVLARRLSFATDADSAQ